ncbi:MAG: efflux RND transporter permease subunit [Bdellovibrionales bacterium]|nr:efflux RND transporter permease subunit [Bdellovibrionales bacterium]
MIGKLIEFSAKNKFLVLFLTGAFAYAGWLGLKNIPVDAIPDLSDTQVVVYSKWNVSPDIIEDQVTYPIVTSLLGVPKVKDIRAVSTFGNSFVYVLFEDGTDIYWARSRVMEYLSKTLPSLPEGVETEMGPDATGVGWIYQYALKDTTGKHSLADLRSFQDWFLRYQLQAVEGVAEIATFGGYEKQYQVEVLPNALRAFRITLKQVLQAIKKGNSETGARVLEFAGTEYMVRARGYVKSKRDIENIVVGTGDGGTPIYVRNVANVKLGPQMRRGAADLDGMGETVGGIVVMRYGENANSVIKRVKNKILNLKGAFPDGVEVVETYDRSDLINRSIQTLTHELRLELIIVAIVIVVFLLHIPSSFVPIVTLPTAVLISFLPMYLAGVSANIMSLGGIAIAIGAMIDAALVVVENCHKKLEVRCRKGVETPLFSTVVEAVREVGPASFYSLLVIAVSFLPIFALEDQEGRLFKPLAYTKTLAMFVAAFLSITLVPALLVLVNHGRRFSFRSQRLTKVLNVVFVGQHWSEDRHPISRFLFRIYGPTVSWVVDHRKTVIGISVSLLVLTIPAFLKLGSEFMPPLNEGSLLYMPTTMPGISIREAKDLLQRQNKILKSFPEVASVHGKVGRAETATDPAPLSMMETVVSLKDPSEWRRAERFYSVLPEFLQWPFYWIVPPHLTWNELVQEMNRKMQFPGTTNAYTMPIKTRIDMLSTGIRTPVGIKIYGDDSKKIEEIGLQLEKLVPTVSGTRSVFAERVAGGYFLDFRFNREALGRFGISVAEAQEVIQHAVGGKTISTTVEGRERYTINVRYASAFRDSVEDLKRVLIDTPKGAQIPLAEVANIEAVTGPGMIRTENGLLVGYVFVDVLDEDIGGYVSRAKELVNKEVKLPPGYSVEWSGQFKSMLRVRDKLSVVVPVTLIIVFLLIYFNTKSVVETSIILLAIPFSAIGAIWLLYLLGYNMSIAVWVGLIALLGVDAETAIFMLLYLTLSYNQHVKRGQMNSMEDLKEAIYEGAVKRIRPKMMTVMTTFVALLPILFAHSSESGADVMKRMAAPMIGGIFSSFLLELLVYPAIFAVWKEWEIRRAARANPGG